jgi:preprotein translocase subunit SecD
MLFNRHTNKQLITKTMNTINNISAGVIAGIIGLCIAFILVIYVLYRTEETIKEFFTKP